MTQKEKDILLKDLCARLPYDVKVQTTYINKETKERKDIGTDILGTVEISLLIEGCEEHKPYLFPMSSMTEEQRKEYLNLCDVCTNDWGNDMYFDTIESLDWLNKNHFDYRGLIPMGLAEDATGKNIY